jgi:hypothetical protein
MIIALFSIFLFSEETMQRNSFLSLVTILFLLFSLSPFTLAQASAAVPTDADWTGTNDRGNSVKFTVGSSGSQWSNFAFSYSFTGTGCGNPYTSFTTTVPGPGSISGGNFTANSGSSESYTGHFTSSSTATGTYTFTNKQFMVMIGYSPCFFYLTASGTWSATVPLPAPTAFSKLSPANAAPNQSPYPTLSWQASTNALSYDYCYSTTNPCSNWKDNGASTSVVLINLTPEATYYWQVRAKNNTATVEANGGVQWSFTVSKTSSVFLPLVLRDTQSPGNFTKSAPTDDAAGQSTSPTLSWNASSNAAIYEYCIDTSDDSTCNGTGTWTSTAASTSVGLSGLAPATRYYWQVRARNAFGTLEADGGTWWSFVTTDAASPGVFNKTSPADMAISVPSNPTLSWEASSGAVSYAYCYATTTGCTNWISTGTNTFVALSGLSLGQVYYWQVRAVNSAGATLADAGAYWSFSTAAPIVPLAGKWLTDDGDGFYVSSDQAFVRYYKFSISLPCYSTYVIGVSPVRIVNNQFSFTGSLYASGTFDSPTTAHGTDGLNNMQIIICGYVSIGPLEWTATWLDSTPPPMAGMGTEVP